MARYRTCIVLAQGSGGATRRAHAQNPSIKKVKLTDAD